MATTDVLGAFEGYVAAEDGFRRLFEAGREDSEQDARGDPDGGRKSGG